MHLGGLREHEQLRDRPRLLEQRAPPTGSTVAPRPRSSSTAACTCAATAGSARRKSSSTTPIRSPRTPSTSSTGSSVSAASSSAQSSAERAIGPTVSSDHATGTTPSVGTRPVVGRRPVTPQKQEGMRIEPAVSVPSVPAARSAAAAAPLPPLEPPQIRSSAHGLCAGPKCGLVVIAPKANSCVFSLPRTIAPARRSRSTQSASRGEMSSARIFDAAVVAVPATSITSLIATGTPRSGPSGTSLGLGERLLGADGDVRVQRAVELLDPLQVRLDGLARRQDAGANAMRDLGDAHAGVSGGRRSSMSASLGRTTARKPSTPSRSSSSTKTPC